jgi:hypothetical protein
MGVGIGNAEGVGVQNELRRQGVESERYATHLKRWQVLVTKATIVPLGGERGVSDDHHWLGRTDRTNPGRSQPDCGSRAMLAPHKTREHTVE